MDKVKNKKTTLSPRNQSEWLELCEWIEINIFNYDISCNQKLQKKACLVLDGLRKGQNIANNFAETYGEYPLNVILLAFKANKIKILNSIKGKIFDDEENQMKYICAIVRKNLNEIYSRYLESQKSKDKSNRVDTDILEYQGAEYQKKSTNDNINKFEGLW